MGCCIALQLLQKIYFFPSSSTKMNGKSIKFGDKKINKSNFYRNKKIFKTEDIDISKILVSKIEPYGKKSSFKYYTRYNDDDHMKPLCIKLP